MGPVGDFVDNSSYVLYSDTHTAIFAMNETRAIKQFPLLPLQVELIDRLRWFIRIRWMAAAGVLITIVVARWVFRFDKLPVVHLLSLVGVIVLLNLIYAFIMVKAFPDRGILDESDLRLASLFAQVQILFDLILITLLLHFSGGMANPFSFFYIFHVIISSILLPRGTAYAYALITVALYSGLILLEETGLIANYPIVNMIESNRTYVVGAIFAFGATVLFAAYVTTSIRLQLKEREEEAEEVRDALLELEEHKSGFMRMVSHELRSPIAAIQSSLGVLLNLEEKCMDDGMRRSVERASHRAEGLFQLTKDLLEFSRLTTLGPKEQDKIDIDLKNIVEQANEFYTPQAIDKGLDFNVSLPDKKLIISANPQSMGQMVDNLVSNAIRYTKAGGKVAVKLSRDDGVVTLVVEDSGIGIPAEDIDRIGEEFYRSRNAKQFAPTGTGIGMRIVREIIRHHGGNLSIESKENEGTTFTVEMPLTSSLNAGGGKT